MDEEHEFEIDQGKTEAQENENTVAETFGVILEWFMGEENRAKNTFKRWYEEHAHVFGDGEIDVEADEQN